MKTIKKLGILIAIAFVAVNSYATNTFDWGTLSDQGHQFYTTAVTVGKYIAGGVLALSLGFMLYQLLGDHPKKKEGVIAFIIALVLNGLLWNFI